MGKDAPPRLTGAVEVGGRSGPAGLPRAVAPQFEAFISPSFGQRLKLVTQPADSGRFNTGKPQGGKKTVAVFHEPQVVDIFSVKAFELEDFQACLVQFVAVARLAFKAMDGERLAQRYDVHLVLTGRQAVRRHPVHRHYLACWLKDSVDFAEKLLPVAVMAGTFDVDDNVDRIVVKGQA